MSSRQDFWAVVATRTAHIDRTECDEQLPKVLFNRDNLHDTTMVRSFERMRWTTPNVIQDNGDIDAKVSNIERSF